LRKMDMCRHIRGAMLRRQEFFVKYEMARI
jgi:hypothetical protein